MLKKPSETQIMLKQSSGELSIGGTTTTDSLDGGAGENDSTVYDEGEGGKSHDYAFYFKSTGQVMRKLESTKPIRASRAQPKKPDARSKSETGGAPDPSAAAGFMFRWQRDKSKNSGLTREADSNEDSTTVADDDMTSVVEPEKGSISRMHQITGNVSVPSLSIAIYLGKQGANAKVIPPKTINQALHLSGGGKGNVATPQQFAAILAGNTASLGREDGIHRRASKINLAAGEAVVDLQDGGITDIDIDGFSKIANQGSEDLDMVVSSLKNTEGWPPAAPKFPPPPPDSEFAEPQPKRIVLGQGEGKGKDRKKSIAAMAGQSSRNIGSGASSRRLGSFSQGSTTDPEALAKLQEKSKTGAWRRPSFMPGMTSRLTLTSPVTPSGSKYIAQRPLPYVLPAPPDPPRPPRPGSNDERKQSERENLQMAFEDMYSSLVGLKLEKIDLDQKCAELEAQIAQSDIAISTMMDVSGLSPDNFTSQTIRPPSIDETISKDSSVSMSSR